MSLWHPAPDTAVEMAETIDRLRLLTGPMPYSDEEIGRVIAHINDFDLAVSAFMMRPKPHWLHAVASGASES